jgi:ribonucleoside-diphosphate reductase beta chain
VHRNLDPAPARTADQPPSLRLWQRAGRTGAWDPRDIDLSQDAVDWMGLADAERDVLLRLTALFHTGGRGMALDLLPLIQIIAREGRLEEELYLTSFLWDEAKHFETFHRFFVEVVRHCEDLAPFRGDAWHRMFDDELPRALRRLRTDASPEAQAEATATYGLIVEGALAETSYHAYHAMLSRNGILPGMQRAVAQLRDDETRHLSYGVYLLSRLVAENGESVWQSIESRVEALLPAALAVIGEAFTPLPRLPFGLDPAEMQQFARTQARKRLECVQAARGRAVADLCGCSDDEGGI